jgi:rare lipoprotein A
MKRQLDLRSGGAMLALGTLGLGGACATGAVLPVHAQAFTDRDTSNASAAQSSHGRRAVVITDSVGAAAAAVAPTTVTVAPVLSATESTRNFLVGGSVSVRGAVHPVVSIHLHRTVELEEHRGGQWTTVARARTHRLGRYRFDFKPHAPGTLKLRVLVAGAASDTRARRTLGAVNVYRKAFASWYGGDGSTACGSTLTSSTLGVASKTLPCGTMVRIRLGDRTVRVPVIDRGPYVAGREFDLTAATKRALGFGDLGTIWVTA